jgi:hypothetical protein
MKKVVLIIGLFSVTLFSCRKEVIVPVSSPDFEQMETRGQKGGQSTYPGQNTGSDTDGITDPNNDADEDRKKKGK